MGRRPVDGSTDRRTGRPNRPADGSTTGERVDRPADRPIDRRTDKKKERKDRVMDWQAGRQADGQLNYQTNRNSILAVTLYAHVPFHRNQVHCIFICLFITIIYYELEISEVIVNKGEVRVNYRFIEIESE